MRESNEPAESFDPIDADADMSPAEVDRWLKRLFNELAFARIALRRARYAEVQAYKAYMEVRHPVLLDPECPQPSRSTGVTVVGREEWINARVPEKYWDHQAKKIVRESAEDYSRQIRDQVKCIQSIGANARQAYDLSGRAG
ncbi:hypothetical protein [Thermomonospora umbrina]|uniref:Uncharacterized protein n=1 Tax=Thermomonospora umbrina TaxID=111806 RepID=A0A3D9SXG5_9ACTN|nr:hypothetical protein [Thermomonospora umbrina]REF00258.1 hypothetical protein DFJ69_5786 [Thermomonospora umbrina]